jgi:hypothetical protein
VRRISRLLDKNKMATTQQLDDIQLRIVQLVREHKSNYNDGVVTFPVGVVFGAEALVRALQNDAISDDDGDADADAADDSPPPLFKSLYWVHCTHDRALSDRLSSGKFMQGVAPDGTLSEVSKWVPNVSPEEAQTIRAEHAALVATRARECTIRGVTCVECTGVNNVCARMLRDGVTGIDMFVSDRAFHNGHGRSVFDRQYFHLVVKDVLEPTHVLLVEPKPKAASEDGVAKIRGFTEAQWHEITYDLYYDKYQDNYANDEPSADEMNWYMSDSQYCFNRAIVDAETAARRRAWLDFAKYQCVMYKRATVTLGRRAGTEDISDAEILQESSAAAV